MSIVLVETLALQNFAQTQETPRAKRKVQSIRASMHRTILVQCSSLSKAISPLKRLRQVPGIESIFRLFSKYQQLFNEIGLLLASMHPAPLHPIGFLVDPIRFVVRYTI